MTKERKVFKKENKLKAVPLNYNSESIKKLANELEIKPEQLFGRRSKLINQRVEDRRLAVKKS